MSVQLAFRLKMAKQKAEALLRDEGLLANIPIDPFAIAASRGITVQAKPDTDAGVSGMLLRHGNSFGILYATHIGSEGFQRFSIAHELGHYFLDGHADHVLKDGIHASHAGFISADPFELEADSFAAGLLMPAAPMKRLFKMNDPGMAVIDKAASDFKTSLTATSIRYAELTDDAVAVIVSTGETIDYCFISEAMKSLPKLSWLRKGSAVPDETATKVFNSDPSKIHRAERTETELDVRHWLGGTQKALVTEEVVGLGAYGKTLTVLSSQSIGSEDETDEEEEERLEESWTPKFRR
jgi:Zn-dependent peptidase ImmA (M78 family)